MNANLKNILVFAAVWAPATAIAMFLALLHRDAAFLGGEYIPLTNDSFFHARRILDAMASGSVAQIENRLHVPDGTWIPWPWAYDYLMAKAAGFAVWLYPDLDPMAPLAHAPVVWIAVNAGLFLGILTALALPIGLRFVAMLAYALFPLNQQIHAIGMLDHHFVELTFVLANVLVGLGWFQRPDSRAAAVGLGVVLGLAPAFHNGLFILQLPALATISLLWFRGRITAPQEIILFGISLVLVTILSVLPSEAIRAGMFEFAVLSWFHVYVAVCSAVCLAFIAQRKFSVLNLGLLVLLAGVLLLPIGNEILRGGAFFMGKISVLDEIFEVRSPFHIMLSSYGVQNLISYYSYFLLLAPLLLIWFAKMLVKDVAPERVFFAAASTLGLLLLLLQFRFHYFGSFALLAGTVLAIDRVTDRKGLGGSAQVLVALLVVALAFQPSLRQRLFIVYAPGADLDYANTRILQKDLEGHCRSDPGVILANHDDGNSLLFHTDCSVIANNFILREEDEKKIAEISQLMMLTPEQLRETRPDIRYLFLRAKSFSIFVEGREQIATSNAIGAALLTDAKPPEGFTLIREIQKSLDDASPYARLYKIERPGSPN